MTAPTIELTRKQLSYAIRKTGKTIASDDWRHGSRDTVVFKHEGRHWTVELNNDHEDGLQFDDDTYKCEEVVKVKRLQSVWVPACGDHKPTAVERWRTLPKQVRQQLMNYLEARIEIITTMGVSAVHVHADDREKNQELRDAWRVLHSFTVEAGGCD